MDLKCKQLGVWWLRIVPSLEIGGDFTNWVYSAAREERKRALLRVPNTQRAHTTNLDRVKYWNDPNRWLRDAANSNSTSAFCAFSIWRREGREEGEAAFPVGLGDAAENGGV